jgi:polysaccharide pyruvyl transferase WcaK-like protein
MKIALIPHVYSKNQGDALCAKEIAQQLNHQDRVFLFENDYTCEELKYIISKCRMLVAERTHASIAGYSQMIPTFVIGYSVKSLGIARDLFGTDEGFVLSYKDIEKNNDLIPPIMDFVSREKEIRLQLEKVIPSYTQKPVMAAKRLAELLR